jgi:hypothetical protein
MTYKLMVTFMLSGKRLSEKEKQCKATSQLENKVYKKNTIQSSTQIKIITPAIQDLVVIIWVQAKALWVR